MNTPLLHYLPEAQPLWGASSPATPTRSGRRAAESAIACGSWTHRFLGERPAAGTSVPRPSSLGRLALLELGTTLCLWGAALAGFAAEDPLNGEFPHAVPFELGDSQFAPGDTITIQSVRGTAESFRTNETYCVEGAYTLASKDEANLALFVTTKQDIRVKTDKRQMVEVKRGTGSFRLIEIVSVEGYPHVSFYPVHSGGGFGGIYFGHGDWLLGAKHSNHSAVPIGSPDAASSNSQGALAEANRVLLEYLGNPVGPPADLDAAYSPARLKDAVRSAAAEAGISLGKVEVDDSEFPFFIGITCAAGEFPKLKQQFAKLKPYEYTGDVSNSRCWVFTLIPQRVWPREFSERIHRREMVRMEMLFDKVRAGD